MNRHALRQARSRVALVVLACSPTACDGTSRMWQPADHDQPARDNAAAVSPEPATGANGDVLVDVTWTRDCAQCHGMSGRGDGPEGRMVRAPDLTRLDWQEAVTDEQIAAIIANGRGKMPKFDLPERTLQGLVRKVRSLVPPR